MKLAIFIGTLATICLSTVEANFFQNILASLLNPASVQGGSGGGGSTGGGSSSNVIFTGNNIGSSQTGNSSNVIISGNEIGGTGSKTGSQSNLIATGNNIFTNGSAPNSNANNVIVTGNGIGGGIFGNIGDLFGGGLGGALGGGGGQQPEQGGGIDTQPIPNGGIDTQPIPDDGIEIQPIQGGGIEIQPILEGLDTEPILGDGAVQQSPVISGVVPQAALVPHVQRNAVTGPFAVFRRSPFPRKPRRNAALGVALCSLRGGCVNVPNANNGGSNNVYSLDDNSWSSRAAPSNYDYRLNDVGCLTFGAAGNMICDSQCQLGGQGVGYCGPYNACVCQYARR